MEWLNWIGDQAWRTWLYITDSRVLATVLGIGFAVLAVGLFLASRTKWGQAKPVSKFVVVSIVLHVWLLMYALGTPKVLPQGDLNAPDQQISVAFEPYSPPPAVAEGPQEMLSDPGATEPMEPIEDAPKDASEDAPVWDEPAPIETLPVPDLLADIDLKNLEPPSLLPALEPTPLPALPPDVEELGNEKAMDPEALSYDSSNAQPAETMPALDALPNPSVPQDVTAQAQSKPLREVSTDQNVQEPRRPVTSSVAPEEYQLRQAQNRLDIARAYGADEDSEAAVEAGLAWLAQAQAANGAWVAASFGGGTETYALGENRNGTGGKADTGVSGLALLAFLSAGHTHFDGSHRETVAKGLQFLIDSQMGSGDMSGPKQVGSDRAILNSRMYCHSIATLALAEAYAMTRDQNLAPSLQRAIQYSIGAQDPRGGGWRYRPRTPGDLSQFGWQAMALKSAQRSGIVIPDPVQARMRRFLDSCAAGRTGGLATYKPREGRPSATMTSEALACRLLLNYPLSLEAQREATALVISQRPGVSEDNVYFWYYATLALFQLQDENWRVWNQAMKERLLQTQVPAYGEQPGSWAPDRLWGGYGGRVYSTAMSCLCLEVYYRYLPMYQRSNLARNRGIPLSR